MPDRSGNFTPREAAEYLGVGTSALRNYHAKGTLVEPGWIYIGTKRQRSYPAEYLRWAKGVLAGASPASKPPST